MYCCNDTLQHLVMNGVEIDPDVLCVLMECRFLNKQGRSLVIKVYFTHLHM